MRQYYALAYLTLSLVVGGSLSHAKVVVSGGESKSIEEILSPLREQPTANTPHDSTKPKNVPFWARFSETYDLEGKYEQFHNFCTWANYFAKQERNQKMNNIFVSVFKFVFRGLEEMVMNLLAVQHSAVDYLSEQMLNPDLPIDSNRHKDLPGRVVEQGLYKIQERKLQPHMVATLSVFGAMSTSLLIDFQERLGWLMDNFGQNFMDSIEESCRSLVKTSKAMKEKFVQFRQALTQKDAFFTSVSYADVKCKTTHRISMIEGFCGVFVIMKEQGLQMLSQVMAST